MAEIDDIISSAERAAKVVVPGSNLTYLDRQAGLNLAKYVKNNTGNILDVQKNTRAISRLNNDLSIIDNSAPFAYGNIVDITLDLNGGDVDTANQFLTYNVYGDLDNYSIPIARVGNTVTAKYIDQNTDIVRLMNVNIGNNQKIKIGIVDEDGNESDLTNAYGSFYLTAGSTDQVSINLRKDLILENDGDYIEIKFRYTSATFSGIFASTYYNKRVIDLTSATKIKVYNENLTPFTYTFNNGFIQNQWQVLRVTKTDITQSVASLTGSNDVVLSGDIGRVKMTTLLALSQDTYTTANKYLTADFEYIEYNGDRLILENTTPSQVSRKGTFGIDVLSKTGTDISSLFTSLLPVATPPTGDPVKPNTPIINRSVNLISISDYILIPFYGQSLSINTNATPYTNATKLHSAFMFDGGLNSTPLTTSYLTPLTKQNDTVTAMANIMQQKGNYSKLVFGTPGEGGKTIAQLSKGTVYYDNLINHVTQLKRIADSEGVGLNVPAIPFAEGEGDTDTNNWNYLADQKQLIADFNTDIKAITRQTNDVKLVMYQMASHTQYHKYPFIPLAQLQAANEDDNIVLVKAMYNGDYYATGNVHGTTQLYSSMGAKFGWYIHNSIINGNPIDKWKIESHYLDVNNLKSTIKITTPVPPLQIDVTEVTPQDDGNLGFILVDRYLDGIDNTTSTISESSVKIESVKLVDETTIEIQYSSNPTGRTLTYGMRGDGYLNIDGNGVDVTMGRVVGARGNIKDSQGDTVEFKVLDDTDTVIYNGQSNYLPIFEIDL